MIIHSIVSQNDIFCTNSIVQPSYENIKGGFVEINDTNGIKQINRLYSTNPYMYLDKRYTPYSTIK